jgi:HlyD family secretion protein
MSCSAEIAVQRADSAISVPIQAVVAAKEETEKAKPGEGNKEPAARVSISVGHRDEEKPDMASFKKTKEAVFVVENGIAREKIVTTGISDDQFIEIKDGLKGDETVVTGRYQALRKLKDGDKVKVEQSAGTDKMKGRSGPGAD